MNMVKWSTFLVLLLCIFHPSINGMEGSLLSSELRQRTGSSIVPSTNNVAQDFMTLVFTSKGGGGHMSASAKIEEDLKEICNVQVEHIFKILDAHDPIKTITCGYCDGEDFYNFLIRNNLLWLANILTGSGRVAMRLNSASYARSLNNYLKDKKVNLIISVVPDINKAVLEVAQKADIPFILVPTDLDGGPCVNGISKPSFDKFYYVMPFKNKEIYQKIAHAQIAPEKIEIGGFPLRSSFFQSFNKEDVKKEFNITSDKPLVMIMMGAAGGAVTSDYVDELSQSSLSLHMIVCVGRNDELYKRLTAKKLPSSIGCTVLNFTDKTAALMSIAELLITKPGSVSFNEALHMQVPFILDATKGILRLEAFNVALTKKYKLGKVITDISKLNAAVTRFLTDKEYVQSRKDAMSQFPQHNFSHYIQNKVKHLIADQTKKTN